MTTTAQVHIISLQEELKRLAAALLDVGSEADVDQLVGQAGSQMGAVYDAAEQAGDQTAMTSLSAAWQHVQALAEQTKRGIALTQALNAALNATAAQRDKALEEMRSIVNAISNWDTSHAVVGSALDAIGEEMEGAAYEQVSDILIDEAIDGLCYGLGIGSSEAARLWDAIRGGDVDDEQLDALIARLQEKRTGRQESRGR